MQNNFYFCIEITKNKELLGMQKLFFELLQVALGQLDCLSRGPLPDEWYELYHIAQRQGLVGICYKGVERLFEYGLRAPQDLCIDWMADTESIRETQELIDRRCQKLMDKLAERKIRSSAMSALAIRQYKVEGLHHFSQLAAIDVFVDCSMERAIKFARQTGQEIVPHNYTSLVLKQWDDMSASLHYRIFSARNPFANHRMQKWFNQHKELMFQYDQEVAIPSMTMNAICMLQELQQRLFSGELALRHFVDLFFVLNQLKGSFDTFRENTSPEAVFKMIGLQRFASGVMWVLQETVALNHEYMLCPPIEEEGRFILQEVMAEKRHPLRLWCHYPMEMIWPKR